MTLAVVYLWQSIVVMVILLDHDLGDHDDGGHGLGDHGDGDHHVFIFVFFVDYSLAHEVGRVRLQL